MTIYLIKDDIVNLYDIYFSQSETSHPFYTVIDEIDIYCSDLDYIKFIIRLFFVRTRLNPKLPVLFRNLTLEKLEKYILRNYNYNNQGYDIQELLKKLEMKYDNKNIS